MLVGLFGCDSGKEPLKGDTDWQRRMNAMFKDASTSPLKDADRKSFTGLPFYKVDSSYIVKAHLRRTPESQFFQMKTTTGDTNMERVFGILTFTMEGKIQKLEVYQSEEVINSIDNRDYLFLPFLDKTNGEETYGGGRYLDLSIPEGDSLIIDFNKAYNPYCVYNENYSCPIVPRTNFVDAYITAGVKIRGK